MSDTRPDERSIDERMEAMSLDALMNPPTNLPCSWCNGQTKHDDSCPLAPGDPLEVACSLCLCKVTEVFNRFERDQFLHTDKNGQKWVQACAACSEQAEREHESAYRSEHAILGTCLICSMPIHPVDALDCWTNNIAAIAHAECLHRFDAKQACPGRPICPNCESDNTIVLHAGAPGTGTVKHCDNCGLEWDSTIRELTISECI